MKEPIVHDGPGFDWEGHAEAGRRVVSEGGKVNWKAAMAADPGCMRCPSCDCWLWRTTGDLECPECGHRWEET